MHNKYPYYMSPYTMNEALRKQYTNVGLNMIKEKKDEGGDVEPSTYGGKDSSRRRGEVIFLQDKELYDITLDAMYDANEKAGWNYHVDCTEALQFSHYREGDFCDWHIDGGSDHFHKYQRLTEDNKHDKSIRTAIDPMHVDKIRKLTISINLSDGNEDYEGGDLYIRNNDGKETYIEEFRKPGSIVIFPSYTSHRITTVTRGNRYSIVLWCLGVPFK